MIHGGEAPSRPGHLGRNTGDDHQAPPSLGAMGLTWEQVVVEASDPVDLGRWWATALGWVVVDEDDEGVVFEIRPTPDEMPGLLFLRSASAKQTKNRVHLDFRPDDQAAEVERLLAHGATRVDVGQGDDVPWVVMADPEGNEFCVLGQPH